MEHQLLNRLNVETSRVSSVEVSDAVLAPRFKAAGGCFIDGW